MVKPNKIQIREQQNLVPYRLNVRRTKVTKFWPGDESFDRRYKVLETSEWQKLTKYK